MTRPDNTGNLVAIASLAIGLLAYSSAPIFIRLSEGEISSNATVFDRLAIATVVLGLWKGLNALLYRLDDQKPEAGEFDISRDFWLLPAMAIFYVGLQVLWSWSLTQTTVAFSTALLSLKPLFTCLFAWIVWNQRFDKNFLIGIVIAICGAGVIGLSDLQVGTNKIEGDIAALLAGIFEAGYLLVVEKLRTKLSATTIMLWCCFFGTLFSLPICLFAKDRLFPYSASGLMFIISLALVSQVLGQVLIAYSLKIFPSASIAIVLLLESIMAGLAAWLIFGERLSLFDWIALLMILLGLYLALSSQSAIEE